MTLQELANLGKFIGAAAVVFSVVYLAVQVRHSTQQLAENTKSQHLGALEANTDLGNRVREPILSDREVAEMFSRGVRDHSSLDDVGRMRFHLLCRNIFAAYQAGYFRHLTFKNDPTNFEWQPPSAGRHASSPRRSRMAR